MPEEGEAIPFSFRYLRMRAHVGQAFNHANATCAHVHEKEGLILLAIGFANGEVLVVDSYGIEQMRWRAHATPVNTISSDKNGTYFASCSDDGYVAVRRIGMTGSQDMSNNQSFMDTLETHPFNQPLECLQLDPCFGTKSDKIFVTGGPQGQLILSKKTWMSQKDLVIHEGEGKIACISWKDSYLAWANDRGVKIIDIDTDEKITFVERPPSEAPGCQLIWESNTSLIIVYDRTVQLIQQFTSAFSPGEQPRTCAQIQKVWELGLDHTICGLAPFNSNSFALLCIVREIDDEDDEDDEVNPMPEIQLRDRFTGESLLLPDALPIQNHQQWIPNHYYLKATAVPLEPVDSIRDVISKAPTLFVISPGEVVVAKVRDFDDQITSALKGHRYREALDIARAHPLMLRRHRLPDLTQQFLEDLLYHEEFDEAAAVCPALLNHDAHAWEFWILRFMKCGQLQVLAPKIPTDSPRLEPAVYQLVLDHFITTSNTAFLATIKLWSNSGGAARSDMLYSLPTTMARIQAQLKDEGPDPLLIEAQALLYAKTRQYEDALNCYLRLDGGNVSDVGMVFDLIEEHSLYGSVRSKVLSLIRLDRELSGKLLLKALSEIPIEVVVRQVEPHPELTLWYLHLLYQKQIELYNDAHYGTLHMKQVQLYVELGNRVDFEFQTPEGQEGKHQSALIGFLTWSWNAQNVPDFYQMAYDLCKECQPKPLWNEMVFILGETQQAQEALKLLLTEVGDVRRAIEFIELETDAALIKELWDSLILFSLENKSFLTGMLDYAGLYSVELPSRVIREIPVKMEIEGLKQKLVSITEDYRFQYALQQRCRDAIETWFYKERTKLYQMQRRGCRAVGSNQLQVGTPSSSLLTPKGSVASPHIGKKYKKTRVSLKSDLLL